LKKSAAVEGMTGISAFLVSYLRHSVDFELEITDAE
jgi:hypothetical protein